MAGCISKTIFFLPEALGRKMEVTLDLCQRLENECKYLHKIVSWEGVLTGPYRSLQKVGLPLPLRHDKHQTRTRP